MENKFYQDLEVLPGILKDTLDLSLGYLNGLDGRKTAVHPTTIDWPSIPDAGLGAQQAARVFEEKFLPFIVASSGPRYWGYVTGGTTPAAIAGDWLATVFDQNTQSTISSAGDCSALLELQTVKLLLDLFGLPDDFIGGFVTGATMSNFSGLAVARQWYGKQLGIDIAREGLRRDLTIYAATPHSSSIKALAMLGIGSKNVLLVPCLPDREAMDMDALEAMLPEDEDEPFIIIASGGTVNSVDFDDMQRLKAIRSKRKCWLHIDAAFGGFAACSPAFSHLLQGWEVADSITIDFHKWLNVPYDSAIILTRKEHAQLQVQTFQNAAAPYLGDPLEKFSYLNFGPENSRRFRALPAWFSLMAYGKEGYRWLVEEDIRLARSLGEKLVNTGYFSLLAPVRLNTVCFTIADQHHDKVKNADLLAELNKEGKVFMTPTVYKGHHGIRAALVNYRTSDKDLHIAVEAMVTALKKLMQS
ncbi:pyridoxal-dependent decarboxylase [Flavihumibacter rivuli]|uniref:pyridoxal phosphate-dependent decarboxylase family protein n=1 Tax=Flavihumibacter rivuli TaxID=2838156 RepID=UPI001BDF6DAE|nr:pyridoxal-dependent decarboxylase [Flavihumibacter rivuli]ULQ57232.1 pyridoxal-dependent decarboxylase [Flavihumibacter rivuli]